MVHVREAISRRYQVINVDALNFFVHRIDIIGAVEENSRSFRNQFVLEILINGRALSLIKFLAPGFNQCIRAVVAEQ